MNSEFKKFLNQNKEVKPPSDLTAKIRAHSELYIKPNLLSVFFKYFSLFTLMAFVSLALCPQKGLGFMDSSKYLFFFDFLHSNPVLCGLYCGVFFFTTTHVVSLMYLNHFERLWLSKKLRYLPHTIYAFCFGLFMFVSNDHMNFKWTYNLAWIAVIFIGLTGLSQFQKNKALH